MIWESCYWKDPLIEMASRFVTLKNVDEITEDQIVQIEKDVFIGFYTIRKLIESITKLTDKARNLTVEVTWFPNVKKVNRMNWHHIEKHYDLEDYHREKRDIRFICNQLIHSYVFTIMENEKGGLYAILFNSENVKDKRLYMLEIDEVIKIFQLIGNDYPSNTKSVLNSETGEYDIIFSE